MTCQVDTGTYKVNVIDMPLIMYPFKVIFSFCQIIMSTSELCWCDAILTHDMKTCNKLAKVAPNIVGPNLKKEHWTKRIYPRNVFGYLVSWICMEAWVMRSNIKWIREIWFASGNSTQMFMKLNKNANKKHTAIYTQLWTGHISLNKHLHRFTVNVVTLTFVSSATWTAQSPSTTTYSTASNTPGKSMLSKPNWAEKHSQLAIY